MLTVGSSSMLGRTIKQTAAEYGKKNFNNRTSKHKIIKYCKGTFFFLLVLCLPLFLLDKKFFRGPPTPACNLEYGLLKP
jgi:hypothetical protein